MHLSACHTHTHTTDMRTCSHAHGPSLSHGMGEINVRFQCMSMQYCGAGMSVCPGGVHARAGPPFLRPTFTHHPMRTSAAFHGLLCDIRLSSGALLGGLGLQRLGRGLSQRLRVALSRLDSIGGRPLAILENLLALLDRI